MLATYFRGGDSGVDYAVNRYYDSATGWFLSADPYMSDEAVANPMLWNRYAYVGGDPVNFGDPRGTNRWLCGDIDAPAGCESHGSSILWFGGSSLVFSWVNDLASR